MIIKLLSYYTIIYTQYLIIYYIYFIIILFMLIRGSNACRFGVNCFSDQTYAADLAGPNETDDTDYDFTYRQVNGYSIYIIHRS